MIHLYYWPTPNGHKITMFLEEAGLEYQIHPVDISAGDQFKPEFLAIGPNNRMPVIVDDAPQDAGEPVSVFESGAILVYLAEKTGRFLPHDLRGRKTVLEWLFISHDLAVVRALAHRVMVLRAGRVVEEGPAADLFAAPREPYTVALMEAAFGKEAADAEV